MMKRYSAVLLLLGTLCAGAPAARAQVLQIDADGTAHKIGPGWSETVTGPTADASTVNSQYVIPAAAVRLEAVRDYVTRQVGRRDGLSDEATLARSGHAHIRNVNYDPNGVVRLAGCVGFQTTIEFAPNERIENVGMGAASHWQVVPNKRADMLFVEPAVALSHNNLTVVTDRHRYYFELVSRDSDTCNRGDVTYSLRLHYPTTPDALLQSTAWRNP
jgi:hypothetical protein